jgi:ornithine cyclodeaminase/alanine dehydrogenase-like protein (mu-crystallin family)
MSGSILELDDDGLWSALERINPVDLLIDELIGQAVDGVGWKQRQFGRVVAWNGDNGDNGDGAAPDLALFEDLTGDRCLLPADGLRASRAATLSALAARQTLAPTVVTVTVLGASPAAQLQLAMIARHVPDVSHIAVCPGEAGPISIEPRVLDQVDLAGIGLSIASGLADAVLGANLVVVSADGPWPLETRQLPKGAVVVNASGQDLPDRLVHDVDQIYVDDAGRLADHEHRYFVRSHLSGRSGTLTRMWTSGTRRHPCIEAPLGQVLTGAHPGRTGLEDLLLVELLSIDQLDAPLAGQLHRAAIECGLGVQRAG